jgi:hypothetical protein
MDLFDKDEFEKFVIRQSDKNIHEDLAAQRLDYIINNTRIREYSNTLVQINKRLAKIKDEVSANEKRYTMLRTYAL